MSSRFILPYADVGSGIKPSDGAQLFFFDTGTSTPKDTFSDQLSTPTPNSNPVIADSKGVFSDIFLVGVYKVVLKDKNNVQIWGADPVDELAKPSDIDSRISNLNPDTIAIAVADTTLLIGDFHTVKDYATGNNSGVLFFKVVAAATGTPDGGRFIDATGSGLQLQQNLKTPYDPKAWGAKGDDGDDTVALNNSKTYALANAKALKFQPGIYNTTDLYSLEDTAGFSVEGESKDSTRLKYIGST